MQTLAEYRVILTSMNSNVGIVPIAILQLFVYTLNNPAYLLLLRYNLYGEKERQLNTNSIQNHEILGISRALIRDCFHKICLYKKLKIPERFSFHDSVPLNSFL